MSSNKQQVSNFQQQRAAVSDPFIYVEIIFIIANLTNPCPLKPDP
jgi:hypothetical protein